MGLNWEDLLLLYLGDDDVEAVGVSKFLEDLIDHIIKKGTVLLDLLVCSFLQITHDLDWLIGNERTPGSTLAR
jgi:hypothetical protein